MTVILCLDSNFGMLFNGRRQSMDLLLYKRIEDDLNGRKLLVNSYSARLFDSTKIICDDNFLENAGRDDICFAENVDLSLYFDKIDKYVLYFWNRTYPSDVKFNNSMYGFLLASETEFKGNSHERITEKIYIRNIKENL